MRLSPGVARRVELSLELERVLTENLSEIAAAHARLVRAVLDPDEPVPDMVAPLECYLRVLALAREVMVEADLAYLAGLDRETELCGERDRLLVAIAKVLSRIRRTCLGWFGRRGLEPLGLADPVAQGSAVLAQAEDAVRCLHAYTPEADPDGGEEGMGPGPGLENWLAGLAGEVEALIQGVAAASTALEELRDGAEDRLDHRNVKIEGFDKHYLSIGRLVEAALRMSGRSEEADRIRPTTRKLTRK